MEALIEPIKDDISSEGVGGMNMSASDGGTTFIRGVEETCPLTFVKVGADEFCADKPP